MTQTDVSTQEELLMRIQQGTPEPNWTVIRPKLSYFVGQIVTWLIMFLLPIGAAIYYVNTPDHAIVLTGASIDSESALQAWRTIDFVLFALLAAGFLAMLVVQMLDFLARERQILVLTPEACLIRLRKKDYFVAYANVTSIVPNIQRGGNIKLHIRVNDGQTTFELDNRFGKAKVLAPQIVSAHRQVVAANKA